MQVIPAHFINSRLGARGHIAVAAQDTKNLWALYRYPEVLFAKIGSIAVCQYIHISALV